MFCKLPRTGTASSAHLSLLPASSFRHLLSLLLNRVTRRPVTDLTGKTQAVLSPSTVKRFLEANKLPHKEGHAALTLTCPLCERETSQTVFINKTTGGLVCPPCKVHATWSEFKSWLSEKQRKPDSALSQVEQQKSQRVQQLVGGAPHLWSEAVRWSEASSELREQAVQVFHLQHLKPELFDKYHVHFVTCKFPSPSGEVRALPCVTFPWYSNAGGGSGPGELIGVKMETLDTPPSRQTAVEPRQGQPGLFGWQTTHPSAREIVLTAHAFDAMAVHQSTGLPAVSLPAGHTHLPLELLPLLEPFERVTLWLGGDQSRQMSHHFARKLSAERCYLVRCREESAMFDSPLDALNKGLDLGEIVKDAQPFKHSKILHFTQLREEVYGELANVDQVAGVKWKRFPHLSNILKGHRAGELTIFTGPTGSGKTTLMSELSLDLSLQGVPTLWGSFEIKNVRLAKIMLRQLSGLNLEKHLTQFPFWADKMEQLPMYFLGFHGAEDVKSVIEAMSHAAYVYDIRHVIIDNLQFMTGDVNMLDRYSVQNHAVSEFRKFASARNVHVTVVIHPRKEDDFSELQTASIFGTAKASQEGDNVVILQKPPTGTKYLQVTKNRFDGDLGKVTLSFDKESLTLSGYFKEKKSGTDKWGASSSKKGGSPTTGSFEPQRVKSVVTKPDRHKGQPPSRQPSLTSRASSPISIIRAREAVKVQPVKTSQPREASNPHPIGTSQPVKTGTKLSDLTRSRQRANTSWDKQKKALESKEMNDMLKFVEEVDLLG